MCREIMPTVPAMPATPTEAGSEPTALQNTASAEDEGAFDGAPAAGLLGPPLTAAAPAAVVSVEEGARVVFRGATASDAAATSASPFTAEDVAVSAATGMAAAVVTEAPCGSRPTPPATATVVPARPPVAAPAASAAAGSSLAAPAAIAPTLDALEKHELSCAAPATETVGRAFGDNGGWRLGALRSSSDRTPPGTSGAEGTGPPGVRFDDDRGGGGEQQQQQLLDEARAAYETQRAHLPLAPDELARRLNAIARQFATRAAAERAAARSTVTREGNHVQSFERGGSDGDDLGDARCRGAEVGDGVDNEDAACERIARALRALAGRIVAANDAAVALPPRAPLARRPRRGQSLPPPASRQTATCIRPFMLAGLSRAAKR